MTTPELSPHLQAVVEGLLASSKGQREIDIDRIGEALGDTRVDADEIDCLFGALERAGFRVGAPRGARGVESLKRVLSAARELQAELGRRPTVDDIAKRSELSTSSVRQALLLAKVMARGQRT